MAEIRLTGSTELQARMRALQNLGPKVMTTLGLTTVREAKRLVHRKTGNLGRTIHIASLTPTMVIVSASAKYAAFVEFGTRAHIITPRAKKALRFAKSPGGARLTGSPRKGAAVVFAKVVHHPGTKAAPFLAPAAHEAVQTVGLSDIVVQTWNNAA